MECRGSATSWQLRLGQKRLWNFQFLCRNACGGDLNHQVSTMAAVRSPCCEEAHTSLIGDTLRLEGERCPLHSRLLQGPVSAQTIMWLQLHEQPPTRNIQVNLLKFLTHSSCEEYQDNDFYFKPLGYEEICVMWQALTDTPGTTWCWTELSG